jgi:hypothetical protein
MDTLKADMHKRPLHRSRAGARHMLGNASVAALASDPKLLEIARQILGYEARPFRATLFDKSPGSNWLVVWHQDTALPLLERHEVLGWGPWSVKEGVIYAHAPATALEQVLALRVHLDESSDRNGPLRVLPGTHLRGVLTDDAIGQLASQIAPVDLFGRKRRNRCYATSDLLEIADRDAETRLTHRICGSIVRHGLARARSAKQRTAGFRQRTAISAHIHDERELCTIEEISCSSCFLSSSS